MSSLRPVKGAGLLAILLVTLFATSCHRRSDALVGRWTVDRVNVEFNEQQATPEMVRQYGEMEKGNVIEICHDSTLIYVTNGDTLRGQYSVKGDVLYLGGKLFGSLHDGVLTTETSTPMGLVTVDYQK